MSKATLSYNNKVINNTNDLVDQDDITDIAILEELSKRYQLDYIYSNIGNIIIACNPYHYIPELYSNGKSRSLFY